MAKDKEYRQLIHTARWLKLRRDTLSTHPCCQRCELEGYITPATEVHHIRPVEEAFLKVERIQRMYDPSNLQALCHACHIRVHTEMGRSGKDATRTRNQKHVKEIIKKFYI